MTGVSTGDLHAERNALIDENARLRSSWDRAVKMVERLPRYDSRILSVNSLPWLIERSAVLAILTAEKP